MQKTSLTSEEFNLLAICSFRYAIGRQTYVVTEITDMLRERRGSLSISSLELITKEINQAIDRQHAGDPKIDLPVWKELEEDLFVELANRLANGN